MTFQNSLNIPTLLKKKIIKVLLTQSKSHNIQTFIELYYNFIIYYFYYFIIIIDIYTPII